MEKQNEHFMLAMLACIVMNTANNWMTAVCFGLIAISQFFVSTWYIMKGE